MPIWEYKIIGSGKGGFATPALLESFLNQLGKEEWEIIRFQSPPDNPLAFSGLARRPTQRDWTLEDAAAAAARAEADKLRAEFEAKFKEASGSAPEEKPETVAAERAAGDDGFRKPRDTESDLDPEADENGEGDDWDKLGSEDELPTFFEAIRPLMRRNQRGPGLSAGVDHLAKRWQMTEEEVVGALKECGLEVPEDEDAPPVYVEYDGDLFWVNVNRRGELWINTKEKPRPVFRVVPGTRVVPDPSAEPAAEPEASDRGGRRRRDSAPESAPADAPPAEPQPIPSGPALLEALVPQMRRDRRGDGLSGSVSFLARALRTRQEDLIAGFAALGLTIEEGQQESPAKIEAGGKTWFLNQRPARRGLDQRPQDPEARGSGGRVRRTGFGRRRRPPGGHRGRAGVPGLRRALAPDRRPPPPCRDQARQLRRRDRPARRDPRQGPGRARLDAPRPRAQDSREAPRQAGLRRARRRNLLVQPDRRGPALAQRQGLEVPRRAQAAIPFEEAGGQ